MALIRVTRISDTGVTIADDGSVRARAVYRVEFDSPLNDGVDAVLAMSIRRGDTYVSPTNVVVPILLAESMEPRKESEDAFNYIVDVGYSSKLWDDYAKSINSGGAQTAAGSPKPHPSKPGSGADNSPLNPLLRPASLRYGTTKVKVPFILDKGNEDGSLRPRPVVNSAGDFFDPPYETDETWITLTIERNETMNDAKAALYYSYFDTINSEKFLWFKPYFCRCEGIAWESQVEPPWAFWKVTYNFVARPARRDEAGKEQSDPWQLRLLDQGTHKLIGGERVKIRDRYGVEVTSPVPLNGAGDELSIADITARNFKYVEYVEFIPKDFNKLLLP